MSKLHSALAAAAAEGLNTIISAVPDPVLRAQLTILAFAVKVPYAFLKEILPSETDEFLKKALDPSKLTKELFSSPEFQQALGNTLQILVSAKERSKRDLIKKVFISAYINQDEYAQNHLERLQLIAQQISLPALQHLLFLKNEILPLRDRELENEVSRQQPPPGFTLAEFKQAKLRTEPISKAYDAWHSEQEKLGQQDTSATHLIEAREQKSRARFSEFWSEFISLGIFKQGSDPIVSTVGRGSGTVQYLTEFGENLIYYLQAESTRVAE